MYAQFKSNIAHIVWFPFNINEYDQGDSRRLYVEGGNSIESEMTRKVTYGTAERYNHSIPEHYPYLWIWINNIGQLKREIG